jgi:hypothetical protein
VVNPLLLPFAGRLLPCACWQDTVYGGDSSWISNDVVTQHEGRIYLNLPAACTLMLVQQQQ